MTGNNLICIRDVPARPILRLRQRLNGADVERRDRRVDFCAAQNRLTASPAAAQRLFLFIDL
jgi:hypothetical protein